MKSLYFSLCLVVVTTWAGICGASSAQFDQTEQTRRLSDGHIESTQLAVKGSSIKAGRAQAILAFPIEKVLPAIYDYANYSKFLPHFNTSKVLSKRGANAIVYLEALVIKSTYKVWVQESFRENTPQGKTRIVEGKMLNGNIKRLDARWELTPVDKDHTLVVFQMLFDPKLLLPNSVVSNQNQIAASRTIKALRDKRLATSKPAL